MVAAEVLAAAAGLAWVAGLVLVVDLVAGSAAAVAPCIKAVLQVFTLVQVAVNFQVGRELVRLQEQMVHLAGVNLIIKFKS